MDFALNLGVELATERLSLHGGAKSFPLHFALVPYLIRSRRSRPTIGWAA
jgi:hypothetical protein